MDRLEIGSNAVAGAGVEVDIWEGDTRGMTLINLCKAQYHTILILPLTHSTISF